MPGQVSTTICVRSFSNDSSRVHFFLSLVRHFFVDSHYLHTYIYISVAHLQVFSIIERGVISREQIQRCGLRDTNHILQTRGVQNTCADNKLSRT
jgi:hypothetical protein